MAKRRGMEAPPSILGPTLKAIGIHAALGAVFLVSFDFVSDKMPSAPETPEVDIVEAVAIDETRLQQQVEQVRQQREAERRAEEQRVAELERRAREAQEQERRAREQQRRERERAEQERAEAAAEAQRLREEAEAAERAAQEAEERRLREEAAAEERRRQEEERRRQEEEARRQAEAEAAARAERERQLEQELQEERARRERARQQRVLTEVERYQALIRSAIQTNWIVESSMRGKSCVLRISLARSGFVTNVVIEDGDRAVCESAQAAVLRAGTLPVSDDPEVYEEMKEIRLRVEPQL